MSTAISSSDSYAVSDWILCGVRLLIIGRLLKFFFWIFPGVPSGGFPGLALRVPSVVRSQKSQSEINMRVWVIRNSAEVFYKVSAGVLSRISSKGSRGIPSGNPTKILSMFPSEISLSDFRECFRTVSIGIFARLLPQFFQWNFLVNLKISTRFLSWFLWKFLLEALQRRWFYRDRSRSILLTGQV